MQVTVKFFGPLSEQTSQGSATFLLNSGATFGHLLEAIGERFGARFHTGLWDAEQKAFKPGILVLGAGRDLNGREMPLQEGEEIKVVPLLGGG
jgi:molybdopterin converting factor small subunit